MSRSHSTRRKHKRSQVRLQRRRCPHCGKWGISRVQVHVMWDGSHVPEVQCFFCRVRTVNRFEPEEVLYRRNVGRNGKAIEAGHHLSGIRGGGPLE